MTPLTRMLRDSEACTSACLELRKETGCPVAWRGEERPPLSASYVSIGVAQNIKTGVCSSPITLLNGVGLAVN